MSVKLLEEIAKYKGVGLVERDHLIIGPANRIKAILSDEGMLCPSPNVSV